MANSAKYIPTVEGTIKAWANLNGTGTVALRDSYNVSSVVDNGVGDYTFNLTNNMNDANYMNSHSQGGTANAVTNISRDNATARTVSSYRMGVLNASFNFIDDAQVGTLVDGDLA